MIGTPVATVIMCLFYADNIFMVELFPVIKSVLTEPKIIFTAVVCIILMNFASFVARYRKKLPKKQVKKLYRQTQEKSSGSDENSGGTNEGGGDSV